MKSARYAFTRKFVVLLAVCLAVGLSAKMRMENPMRVGGGRAENFVYTPENSILIKGQRYSTSLIGLELSDQNLTSADIEPLQYMTNLTNLTALYLYNNQISDISALGGLTNLRELGLGGNPISDWSPVDHVPKVDRLSP